MPIVALAILIIFLIDRAILFLLTPYGVLVGKQNVDVVFTELPALLFFSIYSMIVIRWAEVYYYTKKLKSLKQFSRFQFYFIILNVSMYAAFIILISTFFALHNSQAVNCIHPHSSKTAQSIIAIVYKIYFLVISVTLIIGFCAYGFKIIFVLKKTDMANQRARRFLWLGAVTIICSMCLLAQAINMIVGSYDSNRPLTFQLIFVLVTEIVPSIIFIILWSKGSIFTTAKNIIYKSPKQRTSSTTADGSSHSKSTNTPKDSSMRNSHVLSSDSSEEESNTVSLASVPNGTVPIRLDDSETISLSEH